MNSISKLKHGLRQGEWVAIDVEGTIADTDKILFKKLLRRFNQNEFESFQTFYRSIYNLREIDRKLGLTIGTLSNIMQDIWEGEEKPQPIDEIAISTINNLKKEFDLKIGVVTGNPSHKIISNWLEGIGLEFDSFIFTKNRNERYGLGRFLPKLLIDDNIDNCLKFIEQKPYALSILFLSSEYSKIKYIKLTKTQKDEISYTDKWNGVDLVIRRMIRKS